MSLFLIGLVPIILFLVLLAGLKKSAMFSAYTSLVTAIILTFIVPAWRMPVQGILASILEGFAVAWMPIGFVVIAALFAYDLSVKTGKIETVKKMLGNITTDKRAQALVLAWGFGGFIEGIAGYGTAVAIPAAIMVSLGFNPLNAALICLVANSTPTAFGTVGLPVTTMVSKLGLDKAGNFTPLFTSLLLLLLTCLIPFIIVQMANKEIEGGKNPAFGKGIVQQIIPLRTNDAIKLTIAQYFTPKGNYIHEKGIEPDIKVEMEELLTLKGYANDSEQARKNREKEVEEILVKDKGAEEAKKIIAAGDVQLKRAIEEMNKKLKTVKK